MPRRTANPTQQSKRGSENEPRFLIIGRIRKPHGVKGALKVAIHSDDPDRFKTLDRVFISANPEDHQPQEHRVVDVRVQHADAVIRFEGIETPEDARSYNSRWLFIALEDVTPLADGEMFTWQLIGLEVETVKGRVIGKVASLLETGANDVLVVNGDKGEILLPDIPDVVQEINLHSGKIIVTPLPGLLPED